MVQKFVVEKSGVERSGVEAWGWKVRGRDDLQPKIYGLYSNGIQYSRARDDSASTVATWINLSLLQILNKLKIGKWQMQNQKSNLDLEIEIDFKTFFDPIYDYAMSPANFSHMNQTTT